MKVQHTNEILAALNNPNVEIKMSKKSFYHEVFMPTSIQPGAVYLLSDEGTLLGNKYNMSGEYPVWISNSATSQKVRQNLYDNENLQPIYISARDDMFEKHGVPLLRGFAKTYNSDLNPFEYYHNEVTDTSIINDLVDEDVELLSLYPSMLLFVDLHKSVLDSEKPIIYIEFSDIMGDFNPNFEGSGKVTLDVIEKLQNHENANHLFKSMQAIKLQNTLYGQNGLRIPKNPDSMAYSDYVTFEDWSDNQLITEFPLKAKNLKEATILRFLFMFYEYIAQNADVVFNEDSEMLDLVLRHEPTMEFEQIIAAEFKSLRIDEYSATEHTLATFIMQAIFTKALTGLIGDFLPYSRFKIELANVILYRQLNLMKNYIFDELENLHDLKPAENRDTKVRIGRLPEDDMMSPIIGAWLNRFEDPDVTFDLKVMSEMQAVGKPFNDEGIQHHRSHSVDELLADLSSDDTSEAHAPLYVTDDNIYQMQILNDAMEPTMNLTIFNYNNYHD